MSTKRARQDYDANRHNASILYLREASPAIACDRTGAGEVRGAVVSSSAFMFQSYVVPSRFEGRAYLFLVTCAAVRAKHVHGPGRPCLMCVVVAPSGRLSGVNAFWPCSALQTAAVQMTRRSTLGTNLPNRCLIMGHRTDNMGRKRSGFEFLSTTNLTLMHCVGSCCGVLEFENDCREQDMRHCQASTMITSAACSLVGRQWTGEVDTVQT